MSSRSSPARSDTSLYGVLIITGNRPKISEILLERTYTFLYIIMLAPIGQREEASRTFDTVRTLSCTTLVVDRHRPLASDQGITVERALELCTEKSTLQLIICPLNDISQIVLVKTYDDRWVKKLVFLYKCKYIYILYCQIGFGRHKTCILCEVTSTMLLNVIPLGVVTSQIVSWHARSKIELIIV